MQIAKRALFAVAAIGLAARPASAQIDLSGIWAPIMHEDQAERAPGPEIGDYAGLPITDAARSRGLTWDAALLTMPEHQCQPHPSTYGFRGVGNLRIWVDQDPQTQQVMSINTQIQWMEQRRKIWMDGRPHPPEYAAHTWQGFSTGHWEGDVLVVQTDHLKAGWIRRNGLPLSDRAGMEDRFIRHGDLLTHISMVYDPFYTSEPVVKTNGFRLGLANRLDPYPCESVTEVVRAKGAVPSHLPGTNKAIEEYAAKYNMPIAAAAGGAETALPEFAAKMKTMPVPAKAK